MTTYAIFQNIALIAILVVACAVALKKIAPNLWAKALGRPAGTSGGCSGCGPCEGCAGKARKHG
ncbi:MAG: hypothetical protein QM639_19570 [Rhodocyclaceae bacterium]